MHATEIINAPPPTPTPMAILAPVDITGPGDCEDAEVMGGPVGDEVVDDEEGRCKGVGEEDGDGTEVEEVVVIKSVGCHRTLIAPALTMA